MSAIKNEAIALRELAVKRELSRDAEMVKMALSMALRNSEILFHKIEAFRGYKEDCYLIDDIQQEIGNLLEKIEGLEL